MAEGMLVRAMFYRGVDYRRVLDSGSWVGFFMIGGLEGDWYGKDAISCAQQARAYSRVMYQKQRGGIWTPPPPSKKKKKEKKRKNKQDLKLSEGWFIYRTSQFIQTTIVTKTKYTGKRGWVRMHPWHPAPYRPCWLYRTSGITHVCLKLDFQIATKGKHFDNQLLTSPLSCLVFLS